MYDIFGSQYGRMCINYHLEKPPIESIKEDVSLCHWLLLDRFHEEMPDSNKLEAFGITKTRLDGFIIKK